MELEPGDWVSILDASCGCETGSGRVLMVQHGRTPAENECLIEYNGYGDRHWILAAHCVKVANESVD